MEVDGTPGVPIKTGIEEPRRILQSRAFGEGHLHDALVGLARADHAIVVPHRNPSPLPLLDHVWIGFLDQGTEPAQHLAPPVAQLLDPCVDQLGRRHAGRRPRFVHASCSPRGPPRHLVAYGSTNMYRPVNRSRNSGSSGEYTTHAGGSPKLIATKLAMTVAVKA